MITQVLVVVLCVTAAAVLVIWLIGERGHLLLPSSRAGPKAQGLRGLLNLNALHMYVYGRWPSRYLRAMGIHWRIGGPRTMRRWADRYHGKVLTHDHARGIVTLEHDIPLQDLEQIIPYPVAREIVLKAPPDVAVFECPCRQLRPNPCKPTQVCMAIGQPFVDFVLEHHPRTGRRLTQEEALRLLEEEHERGHVHSAWFKDVMLNRFYAICNCCKCCCGGIEAMTKQNTPMLAASGYVARVDAESCTACGTCVDACPFGALSINDTAVLDWDKCMGCGVCVDRCPSKVISLVRDEGKGVPLDVRALTQMSGAVR